MSFLAQYFGLCPECGEQMKDTFVQYNDAGHLVHVTCPDAPEDDAPTGELCGRCFCYHVGEC